MPVKFENSESCDREGKKAKKRIEKKKKEHFLTLVPSWDYSCLIHNHLGVSN